jgi:hypothetical protein
MTVKKEDITKMLYNQVSLAIAIIGMTVAVVQWVRDPQMDAKAEQAVQNIRITKLEELPEAIKTLNENLNETNQNVVRLTTIIQERVPANK